MRKCSLIVGILSVLLWGSYALAQEAPPDGVWKFDFGSATSPVLDGWYGVWPEVTYDAALKYGFEGKAYRKALDQNRRVQGDTLILDDVTRDCIYGTG